MHTTLRRSRPLRAALTAVALVAGTLAVTALPASAATINVASGEVAIANNGVCSLREAVENANDTALPLAHSDCGGDVGGPDTIVLPAGNYLLGAGGPLFVTGDITITGAGAAATVIDGQNATSVLRVLNTSAVQISGVTIQNGRCEESASCGLGGGISNHDGPMTITDSILTGNVVSCSTSGCGAFGGAIDNESGVLNVINSTLSNNSAVCGAVAPVAGCVTRAGGIYSNSGTLTVTNTTLSGNSVSCSVNAGLCSANGGGLYSVGTFTLVGSTISGNTVTGNCTGTCITQPWGGGMSVSTGPVSITNSTLSGNSASCPGDGCIAGGAFGGGIMNFASGLQVSSSTFSGNSASCAANGCSVEGGGIWTNTIDGSTHFARSIMARNVHNATADNCAPLHRVTNDGDNLEDGGATCGFPTGNADLLPLADNGGLTRTHALGDNSAALDAVTGTCPPPLTDQRGVPRPQDGPDVNVTATCDIGAFERTAVAAVLTLAPPTATSLVGTTHSVTGTVTIGGVAVPGWPVTFSVTGANTTGGVAVTDATGVATFTYTGTNAGTDSITATAPDAIGGTTPPAGPVAKIWTAPPSGGGGGGDDGGDGGHNGGGRITIIENTQADSVGGVRMGRVEFGFHTKELKDKTFRLEDSATKGFKNLKAGTYTVAQDKLDGWKLSQIVCQDPTRNTKIALDARRARIKLKTGEHVTCTFTNKRKG